MLRLTPSQLNRYISMQVQGDTNLRLVLLQGEISNFTRNFKSGHCYFSIRDAESSVRAVMFRSNAERLPFQPESGMHVIAQGSVTVYERDGLYQLQVVDLVPDGIGAQALALKQRREKLAKLGYFSPERKRPIPDMPKKIGIVTSRSGAALQDMLQILRRRYPIGKVCIYAALVQGETAPDSIATAIRTAGADACDVILIGRGGGASETLEAFQADAVATAIFESPVPVISAVGHEIDHCIADEVADLRAPTPSAAAELASVEMDLLYRRIHALQQQMQTVLYAKIAAHRQALDRLGNRLERQSPQQRIILTANQCAALQAKLHSLMQKRLTHTEQSLALLLSRLGAVNPLTVLQRGYAIVYHEDAIVRSADALNAGDTVRLQLTDGVCHAVITTQQGVST